MSYFQNSSIYGSLKQPGNLTATIAAIASSFAAKIANRRVRSRCHIEARRGLAGREGARLRASLYNGEKRMYNPGDLPSLSRNVRSRAERTEIFQLFKI